MISISDIEDRLDKTMNYINCLKIYCEKIKESNKNEEDLEDIIKYIGLSTENLLNVCRDLCKIHNAYGTEMEIKKILENLKNTYIISDRCVEKILFIEKFYRGIRTYDTQKLRIDVDVQKIIDYLDDVFDEIWCYLS